MLHIIRQDRFRNQSSLLRRSFESFSSNSWGLVRDPTPYLLANVVPLKICSFELVNIEMMAGSVVMRARVSKDIVTSLA